VGDTASERTHGLQAFRLLQAHLEAGAILLKELSAERIGDDIKRHLQQTKLTGAGDAARVCDSVEAKKNGAAVWPLARNTSPAL
jgi:hypothetical protein